MRKEYRIPFEQQPPEVQKIIGTRADLYSGIRTAGPNWTLMHARRAKTIAVSGHGVLTPAGYGRRRQRFNNMVRGRYREAIEVIEREGAFQPRFEGNWPKGWTNPATIAKTHPVIFWAGNGDLIVRQPTIGEKIRGQVQESKIGRLGFTLGYYRADLGRPPIKPTLGAYRSYLRKKYPAAGPRTSDLLSALKAPRAPKPSIAKRTWAAIKRTRLR